MKLPPYRMPTTRAICIHMWEKAKQYLHKRGSVILVASVIVWFLGYYPHHSEKLDALDKEISRIEQTEKDFSTKEQKIKELTAFRNLKQQENSYIGRIGHFISPVMKLLGFKKTPYFIPFYNVNICSYFLLDTLYTNYMFYFSS